MEESNNEKNMPNMMSSDGTVPIPSRDLPVKDFPSRDDVVFADKPKSKVMLLGMILLGILAAGGIGFGVWATIDGNTQKEQLNSQISDLRQQVDQLSENQNDITNDGVNEAGSLFLNPVIKALDSEEVYEPMFGIKVVDPNGETDLSMNFSVEDGKIKGCWLGGTECKINGVEGNIYKLEKIYEGNGFGGEKIGFLMTDGTVWYAPIYDDNGVARTELTAKRVNIDGFVKDIVGINYCSTVNGYCNGSTVFVLKDNTILEYKESMF